MAKKKKGDDIDKESKKAGGDGESTGSKVLSFLIVLLIIIIWLAVFAVLIKADVGGFGSNVLTPILKDVPVLNRILPGASYEDNSGESYRTLDEAMARIKELEEELAAVHTSGSANSDYISQLESENVRLKEFEKKQKDFEERVKEFDKNVVFNDKAPDIAEYKAYYEEIAPDNAAEIYRQVVEQQQADQNIIAQAERYAAMDPAKAASILEVMTGDLDLVSDILSTMESDVSAEILQEMSPEYAAKITKKMTMMSEES